MKDVTVYYEFPFQRRNGSIGYIEAELNVQGDIENDSFDYAGTHCTHGQSGTYVGSDYFQADGDITIGASYNTKWERRYIRKMLQVKSHLDKIIELAEQKGIEQHEEDRLAWLDEKAEYQYEERRSYYERD